MQEKRRRDPLLGVNPGRLALHYTHIQTIAMPVRFAPLRRNSRHVYASFLPQRKNTNDRTILTEVKIILVPSWYVCGNKGPKAQKKQNMKLALLTTLLAVFGFAAVAQTATKKNETIVLVHGAWADASAWHGVTPLLQAKGYDVIEVNLPGHGKDETSFATITFQSYVDAVKKAIGAKKNIILVGHSMAGLVISQTAEAIPGQIKELVYLSAFLPRNGESLLSLAKQDPDSHIGKYLVIDEKNGTAVIKKEGIAEVFALDAPAGVQQYLVDNTKAEPLAPLATPVSLTEANFGKVKKVYIYTTQDNAVSFNAQKAMVKNTPVSKEFTITSSHTAFIASAPVLAEDILKSIK